jgi:prevent-host-death family protein
MSSMSTGEARDQFATVINRAAFGKERIVLTRRGKAIVAIVPMEDLEFLQELENRLDLEEARATLVEIKEKGTVPWEKMKADLGF